MIMTGSAISRVVGQIGEVLASEAVGIEEGLENFAGDPFKINIGLKYTRAKDGGYLVDLGLSYTKQKVKEERQLYLEGDQPSLFASGRPLTGPDIDYEVSFPDKAPSSEQ